MKRVLDIIFSLAGLIALSPVFATASCLVALFGGTGPVFFRQERIGLGGRPFFIWKFRTMVANADKLGPKVTASGDRRITSVGRFLRKYKIDELPQLLNVLCGDMSLVGPRPEVRQYVDLYTPEQRKVLDLRPGITDVASIAFLDEEKLLAQAEDREQYYRSVCMPKKIELNLNYAATATVWTDLRIMCETISAIFRPAASPSATAERRTPCR